LEDIFASGILSIFCLELSWEHAANTLIVTQSTIIFELDTLVTVNIHTAIKKEHSGDFRLLLQGYIHVIELFISLRLINRLKCAQAV